MFNKKTLFQLACAAALLTAGCAFAPGAFGARCKTTPCTLFDHGTPFEGHCGSQQNDAKACYCIPNANHKQLPVQSSCSLSGD